MFNRSEVYPEHPQEPVRLRAAELVIGDKRVGPELLLDPDGFVKTREQFTCSRWPWHGRDARKEMRTCGAQKVISVDELLRGSVRNLVWRLRQGGFVAVGLVRKVELGAEVGVRFYHSAHAVEDLSTAP